MSSFDGIAKATHKATAGPGAAATLSVAARANSTPNGALTVFVRYVNTGNQPVYALDRLWTMSSPNEIVEDPAHAYAFVVGDTFQILFGLAPLPTGKRVTYRNVPYATRIEPGEAVSRRVTWPPPVREHSAYCPEGKHAQFETVRICRIVVLVDSVAELPDLETVPAPFDARALKLYRAGVHSLAQRAASPELPLFLSVHKRRPETFGRIRAGSPVR